MAQGNGIPNSIAVRAVLNGRQGYAFFDTVPVAAIGGHPAGTRFLKRNHNNHFYNIQNYQPPYTHWSDLIAIKQNGTVRKTVNLRYTTERLHYNGELWPVLQIMPFVNLTSINRKCFVPRLEDQQPNQAPAQVPNNQIVPNPPGNKKPPITGIPTHAVRALLEHALIYEAKCPILDVDIDVANGAVTSCFHLFDKTAIQQWLRTPNSQQKCPVCNTPCDAYALPEDAPSPITILED